MLESTSPWSCFCPQPVSIYLQDDPPVYHRSISPATRHKTVCLLKRASLSITVTKSRAPIIVGICGRGSPPGPVRGFLEAAGSPLVWPIRRGCVIWSRRAGGRWPGRPLASPADIAAAPISCPPGPLLAPAAMGTPALLLAAGCGLEAPAAPSSAPSALTAAPASFLDAAPAAFLPPAFPPAAPPLGLDTPPPPRSRLEPFPPSPPPFFLNENAWPSALVVCVSPLAFAFSAFACCTLVFCSWSIFLDGFASAIIYSFSCSACACRSRASLSALAMAPTPWRTFGPSLIIPGSSLAGSVRWRAALDARCSRSTMCCSMAAAMKDTHEGDTTLMPWCFARSCSSCIVGSSFKRSSVLGF
mmetsp:Transcript_21203/g.55279  ORF Transcript_21203/g.55279 Transcript_21203/m.55279 type:complete len:358 (-) Transcript_21203:447-1520(-)